MILRQYELRHSKELAHIVNWLCGGQRAIDMPLHYQRVYSRWRTLWPISASDNPRRGLPRTARPRDERTYWAEIAIPFNLDKVQYGIHPDVDYEQDTVRPPAWDGISYQELIYNQLREGRLWVLGERGHKVVQPKTYRNKIAIRHISAPVDLARLRDGVV